MNEVHAGENHIWDSVPQGIPSMIPQTTKSIFKYISVASAYEWQCCLDGDPMVRSTLINQASILGDFLQISHTNRTLS